MKRSPFFESLLSLNIGFAIVSALFIYESAYCVADAPKIVRECLESFSRLLNQIAPLTYHWHTMPEIRQNRAIREVIFLGLTFAIALFLYPFMKLTQAHLRRRPFISLSGFAAFAAVPAAWLYITDATLRGYHPHSFAYVLEPWGELEIIVLGLLLYLVRSDHIGFGATVCMLHYVFWLLLMLTNSYSPQVRLPLSFVFPWSCIAWLHLRRKVREGTALFGRPAETA
jgi:hypothetical protein